MQISENLAYSRILAALQTQAKVIRSPTIIPELADHIACIIEFELAHEPDFDKALQQALEIVCPGGAAEIDENITLLLTFNFSDNMKRLFYGGLCTAFFFIGNGFMFRMLHWPGAGIVLFTGFMALLFVVTPMLITLLLNSLNRISGLELVQQSAAILGCLSFSLGGIFKVQHWPGANISLLFGMLALNVVFMPIFFYRTYKQSLSPAA
ncbi:MAG: hypothetical protein V4543_03700 [Bacteroidota bacterium]